MNKIVSVAPYTTKIFQHTDTPAPVPHPPIFFPIPARSKESVSATPDLIPKVDLEAIEALTKIIGSEIKITKKGTFCFPNLCSSHKTERFTVVGVHPFSTQNTALLFTSPSQRSTEYITQVFLTAILNQRAQTPPQLSTGYTTYKQGILTSVENSQELPATLFTTPPTNRYRRVYSLSAPPTVLSHFEKENLLLRGPKLVGEGGFGLIYEYTSEKGEKYVLKLPKEIILEIPGKAKELAQSERHITRQISREIANVAQGVVDLFLPEPPYEHIPTNVYSFVDGITLEKKIKTEGPLPPQTIANHFLHLVKIIVDYLHLEKRVGHLDLNLQNIMQTQKGHLCLIDFGSSRPLDVKEATTVPMHLAFIPPELTDEEPASEYPLALIDIWQIGVTILSELMGLNPFLEPKEHIFKWIEKSDPKEKEALMKKYGPEPDTKTDRRELLSDFLVNGNITDRTNKIFNLIRTMSEVIPSDTPKKNRTDISDTALYTYCYWISHFLSPLEERLQYSEGIGNPESQTRKNFNAEMTQLSTPYEQLAHIYSV